MTLAPFALNRSSTQQSFRALATDGTVPRSMRSFRNHAVFAAGYVSLRQARRYSTSRLLPSGHSTPQGLAGTGRTMLVLETEVISESRTRVRAGIPCSPPPRARSSIDYCIRVLFNVPLVDCTLVG